MPEVGLYNGSVSSGGTNGVLVTGANPIVASGGLAEGSNSETSPIQLALRTTQSGKSAKAGLTITPTGTNAAKWALAPDSGGSPGTWGAYGAALTTSADVTSTNTIIWAKAKCTSAESAQTDTSVTLVVSPDRWNRAPTFTSGPQPTTIYDTSATLTWAASDADSDSITSKVIIKTSSSAPSDSDWDAESNRTSPYTKTGLTANTTYFYWVRVTDGTDATVSSVGSFATSIISSTNNVLDARASLASSGTGPYAAAATTSPWYDHSANAYNGVLTNGPIWRCAGTLADPYCLELDGTNDYVDFGAGSRYQILGNGNSWSVEVWFKTSNANATNRGLFDTFVSGSGGWAVVVGTAQQFRVVLAKINGAASDALVSTATVNDGNWHHGVVTYNGSTKALKVYVDAGTPDTKTLADYPVNDSTENLKMGGDGVSSLPFPGRIAQGRIYTRELSSTEVANHYAAGVTA